MIYQTTLLNSWLTYNIILSHVGQFLNIYIQSGKKAGINSKNIQYVHRT